jgi:hypothetical protein
MGLCLMGSPNYALNSRLGAYLLAIVQPQGRPMPSEPSDYLFVLHAHDADDWVRGELLPKLARAGLAIVALMTVATE